MCVYVYAYMHVCMYVCVRVCACMHLHMCARECECMCVLGRLRRGWGGLVAKKQFPSKSE
jgi:hypothetical protein